MKFLTNICWVESSNSLFLQVLLEIFLILLKSLLVFSGKVVSANSFLRKELNNLEIKANIKTYVPKINYSTDNAAMIGISGYFKFIESDFGKFSDYSVSKYNL